MKLLLCALSAAALFLPLPLWGFGPPTMVRPGLFVSNAAGLPLEALEERDGLPEEGYVLQVEKRDQGTREILFLEGVQIASRSISGKLPRLKIEEERDGAVVYRAELDGNGLQSEWWPDEDREYTYDNIDPVRIKNSSYHYSEKGNLVVIRGDEEFFLALGDALVYEEYPLHASLFSGSAGSGEHAYRLWEGDDLSRLELRETLEDGWLRETLIGSDGSEEIRIFDDETRLREIRGRNESDYYLFLYEYSGPELVRVSWRSAGEREESRFLYNEDTLDRVTSYRNGIIVQSITLEDNAYLISRYREGEEVFRERIPSSDIHHFLEQFHTLEPSSF